MADGHGEEPGTTRAIHLIVSGRVQGVGFRYFVARRADALGIRGWIANRCDGDVEIWAEGLSDALEEIEEAARVGPSRAVVQQVRRTDAAPSGGFRGFEVRPGD